MRLEGRGRKVAKWQGFKVSKFQGFRMKGHEGAKTKAFFECQRNEESLKR